MNALELLRIENIGIGEWLAVMFQAGTIYTAGSVTEGALMQKGEPPIAWLKFMKPDATVGGQPELKIMQVGTPWVSDGGFEKKV